MEENQEIEFYQSPIASPMCSEIMRKKILRMAKKLMLEKKLRRGVKEVVKAIRKKEKGIVILAGDISPIDVLSHIPIQCENNEIPYIYVRSRMELGQAAQTKKPTSVILMKKPENEALLSRYQKLAEKIKNLNLYIK